MRGAIGGLALAWAGFAALAAVLGLAGPLSWRLDVLAHFAPLYGLLAVACAALAMLARRPWRGWILVLAATALLASALLMLREFRRPAGPQAPLDAPGQIKVIQFNAGRSNTDIARSAAWLIAQDPDVVTLSEARHDLRDLLVNRAGWKVAGAHSNLMIFTRERYLRMNRPRRAGGWEVTFVNASYAGPDRPTEVVTTHLAWPTDPALPRQVRHVEAVVGELPRERMILTGDFNATPWSAALRLLDANLGLTRRDRALATYPAELFGRPWPLPFLPIDHIYAGPGWATVKVERGPWLGSDHYPVIVTLAPVARR